MIISVNANAAVDRVLFIPRFLPGQTMRPDTALNCIGGKGADAGLVLSVLGAPHLLISFMAGETGLLLEKLYRQAGIHSDLVWVNGETRTSYVIVETECNQHSHLTTKGYTVTSGDCERLMERTAAQVTEGDWIILAGSLPGGAPETFYREITDLVHTKGGKVLIDCAGRPLKQSLQSQPDVVKMNQHEFQETFHKPLTDLGGLEKDAREVLDERSLKTILITLGDRGILAVTENESFFSPGLKLTEVNAAGAGDAVSAAAAFRLALGDNWHSVLQWASAAGAAVVITQGTAECSLETIEKFRPQILVERFACVH